MVVNCDLEPECVDLELRVALQWIAASELGLPVLYFRKSKEQRIAKVGKAVGKSNTTYNKCATLIMLTCLKKKKKVIAP